MKPRIQPRQHHAIGLLGHGCRGHQAHPHRCGHSATPFQLGEHSLPQAACQRHQHQREQDQRDRDRLMAHYA